MRTKYLKLLISGVLTILSYAILLPLLILVRDVLGFNNEVVFNLVQLLVFGFVYLFLAVIVEFVFKHYNDRLLRLRKENGGRDIAAEERHEDESSGLISLSISDKK